MIDHVSLLSYPEAVRNARAARHPSVTAMKADLRPVNAEGVISN
jgi:hypothetical protein